MYFILRTRYNIRVRNDYPNDRQREKGIGKDCSDILLRGCTIMKHLARAKEYCSCCGRVIHKKGTHDELNSREVWSYFSMNHLSEMSYQSFHMCKDCYEKLIANFDVPTEECMTDDMPMYTEEELDLLNDAYARELVCK